MWSLLVITSIIFQSAVAIFLLNGVRTDDDIEKHLRAMLIILMVHLSTKFLLLAVLKDVFLYAQMPTGFSFAYGPLLLVIARGLLGRPMRPRAILWQFTPFLLFSLIYVFLVIAGATGAITRPAIAGYGAWYEWLLIPSMYGYPIYVKVLLRGSRTKKARLTRQISNILLLGLSTGLILFFLHSKVIPIPGFDLRLLPYIFFSAIPVLILRYRLQSDQEKKILLQKPVAQPNPAPELTLVAPAAMQELAAIPQFPPAADRRYEKSGLDAGRMDEYEAALAAYMLKSKVYLDPDLDLDLLASRIKMSKHHLTQLLNERVMKNFYSFVNEYRIGEAIDRLNDAPSQENILTLAFDCGFNSRSSFNNYFKKITGYTPTAYRKLQAQQPGNKHGLRPPRFIQGTSSSV